MRLLDRFANRYSQRDGYWEGMASGAAVLLPLGYDGDHESVAATLVSQAMQAYSTNGIVFAVILARLMLLSEARFKFRDKTDGSLSNLPPRAGILENPWPNGSTGELIARMEQAASLAGNFYGWRAEDDLIVPLPAQEVTIVSHEIPAGGGRSYRQVVGYMWQPTPQPGIEKTPPQLFSVDEIAHYKPIPDPNARFRGMSWLTPILSEVRADSGMTFYKTQFLNHGQSVVAIKYTQKLRPETIDAVADRLMSKYGGTANAYRPLVLDQGADPIIGPGLKELDTAAIQAVGEERICAAGGVPPEIVGLREATSEVYGPMVRKFADLTCRPLWRSMCDTLATIITVPVGDELWFDTADIAALQAAETERAQVVQVSAAAILTFVQAGFTRESIIKAVTTGDLSLLKPDPNAPTPGVQERETIAVADNGAPVTGPDAGQIPKGDAPVGTNGKQGVPPGGGQTLTKPQTAATKKPMPGSIPTPKTAAPSSNGRG